MNRRVFSTAWLAMFPVMYLVHLVDERYFWIGTAEFARGLVAGVLSF